MTEPDVALGPNAARFEELTPDRKAFLESMLSRRLDSGQPFLPGLVGLVVEEVRRDYSRMRMPYRPELDQPAGVVHGGAMSTLVDTVVVPAISSAYDRVPVMLTLHLGVNFLSALRAEDAVAEGWVQRRGRRNLFCQVEVRGGTTGDLAAVGELVYAVRDLPDMPEIPR